MKRYLLVEDDCAPDAREYFNKALKEKFGLITSDFLYNGEKIESEDGLHIEWRLGDYILSYDGDDPHYKLGKA